MAELIYNVKNLFSNGIDGCLLDYEAEFYHIASYQRGYKWGFDENGAVSILLSDLKSAFVKSLDSNKPIDYYLQYITLKKIDGTNYLEVIDGQQRLTTLSIMLSVLSYLTDVENIAKDRLDYAVRSNFFKNYIYQNDKIELLLACEWDRNTGLTIDDEYFNNQDTYYIFGALKKCHSFFSEFDEDEQKRFYSFLLNQVQIIVNVVEHVSSEKVFSNLNSNKIPLTEAELIKALFITKQARTTTDLQKKSFREIQEQRLILGRRWDEIENWVNDKMIRSFYFGSFNDPMFGFLSLVAKNIEDITFKEQTSHHELFNFFNHQNIAIIQKELYNTFWILKDWIKDPIIHNRLGYLFFYKGSKISILDFVKYFKYKSKDSFYNKLLQKVLANIPIGLDINYEDNPSEIHKILLALNIFSTNVKFDFYSYIKEKWTLEHIFPQTPEGKKNILTVSDKENIIEMVNEDDKEKVKRILKKKERNSEEKEIYTDALKRSGYIHHLGNMCLLSNVDNILNGCGFYDEKRTKILKRIKNGGFIPSHTIEIFTKSIFDENPDDFTRWNKTNIDSHAQIIQDKISDLTNLLKEEAQHESR
ncbi:DUF262 domain-containing protein [Chryseobacterium foetidum]|uniref:DUF262 domain-containing protein n=1 Tax=Chryseobacterium foetidum TaxID=2951057 RepID=UPI0021CA7DEC|nr:DUF262 domain-containing protein [Chryseobacterium foetidum]